MHDTKSVGFARLRLHYGRETAEKPEKNCSTEQGRLERLLGKRKAAEKPSRNYSGSGRRRERRWGRPQEAVENVGGAGHKPRRPCDVVPRRAQYHPSHLVAQRLPPWQQGPGGGVQIDLRPHVAMRARLKAASTRAFRVQQPRPSPGASRRKG